MAKKNNFDVKLPHRALTDADLLNYARTIRIPYFQGVFMGNTLPKSPHYHESAIVNLDDERGPGTHWVAYRKRGNNFVYFDSFGDLQTPVELMNYLGVSTVKYNHEKYQDYNSYNCGHLYLKFLCQAI